MAKKRTTINVQGTDIRLYQDNEQDFISMTDIAKKVNDRTDIVITNWLRNRNTIEFLGVWEQLNNPSFNSIEFDGIRNQTGLNSFILTPKQWIGKTNAIGIHSKTGRYGGTYAHKDIAFEFLSHLSPAFKLYVIKEFQRLKDVELSERGMQLDWDLKRTLSKINYTVHTDAIKEELIPPRMKKDQGFIYAGEADILNIAVFGMTAKMWRTSNPKLKGNIRDYATPEQLLVLSNLESVNAELIRMKLGEDERTDILNQAAIKQMQSLLSSPSIKKLPPSK